MDYLRRYKEWLSNPYIDEDTKDELNNISSDNNEIKERFYKSLEFGTGGIRGIMGAGDNRMNVYTVAKATKGLANYILKNKDPEKSGVAIAYDSRHNSKEFAETAALVLNENGIKTYIFPSLRPTPMLSFAIRELNCIAGIVITASHNPPEYNGYKVYFKDGAQVPFPVDGYIIDEVNKVESYKDAALMNKGFAIKRGLFNSVSSDVDDRYYKNVLAQIVDPNVIKDMKHDIKIVYTPLHGSGNIPVRKVLKEAGFKNIFVVKEQEDPDPNFSTVGYPNPEDPKVFLLAQKLAKDVNADLIIGTDPDADRVGAVVKDHDGHYKVLTGNMTGTLVLEYILRNYKENKTMPKNPAVVSTIVSTDLTKLICEEYGVDYFETLTGFKYIGEKIKQFEETKSYSYVFGFEESYGLLKGTYARDKDAIVASLLFSEVASYYKRQGKTLYDGILELYDKYGYHKDAIENITLKGLDGVKKMKEILSTLRQTPFSVVNGQRVVEIRDYEAQTIKNLITDKTTVSTLPKSNVLYYVLEDGSWFCIRPSGTEPKIKIYFGVKDADEHFANQKMEKVVTEVMNTIHAI